MKVLISVDVFAFFSRRTLAKLQLVSKQFDNIITAYFFKYPYIRLHWVSIEHGRLHLQLDSSEDWFYSSSTKTLAQLMSPLLFGGEDSDSDEEESTESESSVQNSSPQASSVSPDYVAPYVRFDNLTIILDNYFLPEEFQNKILRHGHLFKPGLPRLFILLNCQDWWKHWDTVRALDLLVDDLWIFFLGSASFKVPPDFSFFDSQVVQNCKHLFIEGPYEPRDGFIKCAEVAEWLHASSIGGYRQLAVTPKYLMEGANTLQQLLVQNFQLTSPPPSAHDYLCFLYGVFNDFYDDDEEDMDEDRGFHEQEPLIHKKTNTELKIIPNQILRSAGNHEFKSRDDFSSFKMPISINDVC